MAEANRKTRKRTRRESGEQREGFYLGATELAAMLQISRKTINDQFNKGKIAGSFRVGDRYRISFVDAIRNWPSLAQVGGPLHEWAKKHGLAERIPPSDTIRASMEVGG